MDLVEEQSKAEYEHTCTSSYACRDMKEYKQLVERHFPPLFATTRHRYSAKLLLRRQMRLIVCA